MFANQLQFCFSFAHLQRFTETIHHKWCVSTNFTLFFLSFFFCWFVRRWCATQCWKLCDRQNEKKIKPNHYHYYTHRIHWHANISFSTQFVSAFSVFKSFVFSSYWIIYNITKYTAKKNIPFLYVLYCDVGMCLYTLCARFTLSSLQKNLFTTENIKKTFNNGQTLAGIAFAGYTPFFPYHKVRSTVMYLIFVYITNSGGIQVNVDVYVCIVNGMVRWLLQFQPFCFCFFVSLPLFLLPFSFLVLVCLLLLLGIILILFDFRFVRAFYHNLCYTWIYTHTLAVHIIFIAHQAMYIQTINISQYVM